MCNMNMKKCLDGISLSFAEESLRAKLTFIPLFVLSAIHFMDICNLFLDIGCSIRP